MAGKIPQSFIDDLLNRADVVELIDQRVPLKKAGREFTACCPFHTEKTPSFTVSPAKQFYHCFGCGAHGTALGFLMEYEHLSFPEAIEELARTMGMEVPREEQSHAVSQKNNNNDLYPIMEQADIFFRQQLREHSSANVAIEYLKQRDVSGACAAAFGIGYAPPGRNNLQHALVDLGISREKLVQAGLLIRNDEGKHYDRFRGRIMFPIRDQRGRTIAFGGRVLANETPKYLNSPETPLFHKGRELYGLYEARKALRNIPHLLVVEGYMDVISLAQFDLRYAVATLGTATTAEHLSRLFRISSKLVFCFDGDRAGREAAWRAVENSLSVMREGREITFMFLPEGEDPDSSVRKLGKVDFEKELEKALPFSEFLFNTLSNNVDMNSIDGRARLVESARPLLARLPQGVYRQMMTARLSDLAKLAPDAVEHVVSQSATKDRPKNKPNRLAFSNKPTKTSPTLIRAAIELLLQRPSLANLAGDATRFIDLNLPGSDLLVAVLVMVQENPHLKSGALLERWRDTEFGSHLAKLATKPSLVNEEHLQAEFCGVLTRLDERHNDQRMEVLLSKANQEGLSSDEKIELKQLLNR